MISMQLCKPVVESALFHALHLSQVPVRRSDEVATYGVGGNIH
jgi:hypothetical protein